MRYHAQRQKRYRRRPDGVEVIEWKDDEQASAWLMYEQVKDWVCAHMHIDKVDDPKSAQDEAIKRISRTIRERPSWRK